MAARKVRKKVAAKRTAKKPESRATKSATNADDDVDELTGHDDRTSFIVPGAIVAGLAVLLVVVHYGLWLGHNSVTDYLSLKHEITETQVQLDTLAERNQALLTEVVGLKSGVASVESRARNDLGLVRRGETFYQIIDHVNSAPSEQSATRSSGQSLSGSSSIE